MTEMFEQCRALMETMVSGPGSWMGGMMPMGGGGMMLVGLVWLALLVAAGAAIVWLIIRGGGRSTDPDARQVLDVRYARGELDRETYLHMRADLADRAPAAR
jgi:putative membrane protein